ncbi:MAG: hypothetical protein ACXADB_00350 [Candidatus Hermodarchaeia archaeon]|jgi:hypothetical protein
METFDVGKLLIRIGSILIIIAGIVQLGEYAIYNVMDLLNYGQLYIWPIFGMVSGVVAIIIGFLLLFFFYRMIDTNRINAAILILIFGIIGAVFAWDWGIIGGPGAVLILVGAILIFIESEQGGA